MVPVRVLVFSPSRCGMRLGLSRAVSSRVCPAFEVLVWCHAFVVSPSLVLDGTPSSQTHNLFIEHTHMYARESREGEERGSQECFSSWAGIGGLGDPPLENKKLLKSRGLPKKKNPGSKSNTGAERIDS